MSLSSLLARGSRASSAVERKTPRWRSLLYFYPRISGIDEIISYWIVRLTHSAFGTGRRHGGVGKRPQTSARSLHCVFGRRRRRWNRKKKTVFAPFDFFHSFRLGLGIIIVGASWWNTQRQRGGLRWYSYGVPRPFARATPGELQQSPRHRRPVAAYICRRPTTRTRWNNRVLNKENNVFPKVIFLYAHTHIHTHREPRVVFSTSAACTLEKKKRTFFKNNSYDYIKNNNFSVSRTRVIS